MSGAAPCSVGRRVGPFGCHRPEGYTQEIDNVLLIPGVPRQPECLSVSSNAGGGWVRDQDLIKK